MIIRRMGVQHRSGLLSDYELTAFCFTVYPDFRFISSATSPIYMQNINLISPGLIGIHGGLGAIMRH
jgi:hypothetical protein